MIKVIVGLGNPGKEYANTRHNMGFLVLKEMATKLGEIFRRESRFEGWRTKVRLGSAGVDLFFPTTFMNESGRAVVKLAKYFSFRPEEILIVVDDMALPFGEVRFRASGSPGGHNGLKSIERELGSANYPRLRVGIGAAPGTYVDHVLGNFTKEEGQALPEVIARAVDALQNIVNEGVIKDETTTKHAV